MDLNRATVFVRVVESGGFTRAAEAIGLPPSSVSRSVARLEEDLGVSLLERTTRKVALTEAGRAYFERAREALAGLEEATSLALDVAREIHGPVRVALPFEIGTTCGSVLGDVATAHPKIRLEITFTNRGAELVGDLVDLAVVIGALPDSSLVTRRLSEVTTQLFAAPAYLARAGKPRAFADLAKHETIVGRAHAGEARWELVGPRGLEKVDVRGRIVADHVQFMTDAAVAGLGIALLPSWVAEPHVAAGALIAILPRYGAQTPLHVVAHATRHLPRRVVVVRDHLIATLGGHCTKHAR